MTTYRERDHPRAADGRWVSKGAVGAMFAARERTKVAVGGGSSALFWSASAGFRPSQIALGVIAGLGLGWLAGRHHKVLGRAAVGVGKGARWSWWRMRPLLGAPVTPQALSKPRLWHPVNRVRWHARRSWKRKKARWKRKLTPKMVVRYRKNRDAWRRWQKRRALPPGSRR